MTNNPPTWKIQAIEIPNKFQFEVPLPVGAKFLDLRISTQGARPPFFVLIYAADMARNKQIHSFRMLKSGDKVADSVFSRAELVGSCSDVIRGETLFLFVVRPAPVEGGTQSP